MSANKLFVILALAGFTFLTGCHKEDNTSISAQQQLINDVATIDQYLKDHNITAYTDVNGLRYTITSVGKGYPPRLDNAVKVIYTGSVLFNNTPFASAVTSDSTLTPYDYITGWQIGLRLLPEGTKATIYIPSGLAYGNQANGPIPANAILVFDMQLVKVYTTTAEQTQLSSDVADIDQYLASKSITATKDPSGLRYVITQTGTGITPTWYSQVSMNVTGKTLVTGTQFYSSALAPSSTSDSRVVNYIRCFQTALQLLPMGSKATLYVPSGLGFGTSGSADGSVPSNTNIVYDVELTNVTN